MGQITSGPDLRVVQKDIETITLTEYDDYDQRIKCISDLLSVSQIVQSDSSGPCHHSAHSPLHHITSAAKLGASALIRFVVGNGCRCLSVRNDSIEMAPF